MALFFSEQKPKAKATKQLTLTIQGLDYQGLGVAKQNGKTWFVENALPSEKVVAQIVDEKRQYGRAKTLHILHPAENRQTPFCPVYGKCGGCQMQHIPLEMQRNCKQQTLFNRLQRLQIQPIMLMPMMVGEDRHYRRRAKLGIQLQKNRPALGFRQAQSQQVVSIHHCAMLEPELSALLPNLQQLVANWQKPKTLGHIELVKADNTITLFLRHIGQLSTQDRHNLEQFSQNEQLSLFLMGDDEKLVQLTGIQPFYQLNGLQLAFSVRDFIQVNRKLNEQMVTTALDWLDLQATDRVLDLFCGMGNFSLPMAKIAQTVVGVEGVEAMVEQAKQNARTSGLTNAEFYQTDLAASFKNQPWALEKFNKVLLDPARSGALFALDHLCELNPERIVYVSCNPATLVRDAEKLIEQGYRLQQTAMIDMFAHTGHLESVSLFVR